MAKGGVIRVIGRPHLAPPTALVSESLLHFWYSEVMKTIHQTVHFKAHPKAVYDALMDGHQHAEFTSGAAKIDARIGGKFEVYDGYAVGEFTQLEPGKLIESTWREAADDWPEGKSSTVSYTLSADGQGAKLELTQTGVPDDRYKDISLGWQDYYWKPLAEYLAK